MTLTSFTIADHGVTIGKPLQGVTGRLGWSALRTQAPAPQAPPLSPPGAPEPPGRPR